jgi:hypothetical protein
LGEGAALNWQRSSFNTSETVAFNGCRNSFNSVQEQLKRGRIENSTCWRSSFNCVEEQVQLGGGTVSTKQRSNSNALEKQPPYKKVAAFAQ